MPFLCRAVFHPGRGNGLTSFWLVFVLHSPGPVFAVLAALVALPGDFLIFGASQKPGKRSSCTAPAFWIFAVSPVLLHDDWAKKRGGNVEAFVSCRGYNTPKSIDNKAVLHSPKTGPVPGPVLNGTSPIRRPETGPPTTQLGLPLFLARGTV